MSGWLRLACAAAAALTGGALLALAAGFVAVYAGFAGRQWTSRGIGPVIPAALVGFVLGCAAAGWLAWRYLPRA